MLTLWEGKVPAITIVVPLAWHYLTRLLARPQSADVLLLLVLGIDFVGLTSSAALVAPIMASAALLAAVLLRSRVTALGAACFVLAPLLAGIATALGPGVPTGIPPQALPATTVFVYMFGSGWLTVLSVLAVVLGTWSMRGPARVLACCASLAGLVTLLPGFFDLVNAVTGGGPVAWRMIFVIPTAVLVGMLASVQFPALPLRRWPAAASWPTAELLLGGLVVLAVLHGSAVWLPTPYSGTGPFQWKVDQAGLRDLRAVEGVRSPPGTWLLPEPAMGVLAVSTTRRTAVVPREYYLPTLATTPADLRDRLVLYSLVSGRYVTVPQARGALHRLGVSLACVPAEDARANRTLQRAVRAPLEAHGPLRCHVGRT